MKSSGHAFEPLYEAGDGCALTRGLHEQVQMIRHETPGIDSKIVSFLAFSYEPFNAFA